MRLKTGVLVCLSSLAALISCGEDDEEKPPEPVAPVVSTLATAACDLAFRCCETGEVAYYLGPYLSKVNCTERLLNASSFAPAIIFQLQPIVGSRMALPNLEALEQAHRDGRGTIIPAEVQKCIEYLQTLACNKPKQEPDGCVAPELPPKHTPCDPELLFQGFVPEGGICSSGMASLECQPGLVCGRTGELGAFGRCVRAGEVGDPCFADGECKRDLYCSQLDGTCQEFRKLGESCMYADREDLSPAVDTLLIRCEEGLSCDHVTDTCVAPCTRGAVCKSDAECDEEAELTCIVGRCDKPRGEGLPCAEDADCEETLHCKVDPNDPKSMACAKGLENDKPCTTHKECNSEFCKPDTLRCAPKLPPGSVCSTGLDAECNQGTCEPEEIACVENTDCPSSKVCNKLVGQCSSYCVALKPDGAQCTASTECSSEACVAGYCRKLPLADSQACEQDSQCDSKFCSLDDKRVCKKLPLALGEPCVSADQCESGVCFGSSLSVPKTCTSGLEEGAACGKSDQAPCNPKKYFCDFEEEPPVCVPLHETGEQCDSKVQCRGDCVLRFGRMMCAPIETEDTVACIGSAATSAEK